MCYKPIEPKGYLDHQIKENLMMQIIENVTNEVTKKGEVFHIEYKNNAHFEEGLEADIITIEELLNFDISDVDYNHFELHTSEDGTYLKFSKPGLRYHFVFKVYFKNNENIIAYSDYLKDSLKSLEIGNMLYQRTKLGIDYPMWKGDYDIKTREDFINDLNDKNNLLEFIMYGHGDTEERFFIKLSNRNENFRYSIITKEG